ncbi:hypothetical protein ACSW9O_16075 (plasmid) [Clostridium perfringens]
MAKLARYRSIDYIVNHNDKQYLWIGSKGDKIDIKEVPDETYQWLLMATSTIDTGELVVVDEESKQDAINSVGNEEILDNNTHTRSEIEKILSGNMNSMKSKLNKIDLPEEKQFILEVAREMNIDSSTKRKFLKEWAGIEGLSTDEIFEDEE